MGKDQFDSISLKKYAEESYLNYAMYVILDRALPNVGDGFKTCAKKDSIRNVRIRIRCIIQI